MEPITDNELEQLSGTLAKRGPLDEIETISRKGLKYDDERMAEAIRVENERLRCGMVAMGLTEQEVDLGIASKDFARVNFRQVMELAIAGSARTGLKLPHEIDRIMLRLEQVRLELISQGADSSDENRMGLVQEEESLVRQLVMIGGLQRHLAREAIDGQAKLALVNHKIANGGSMKKVRPGFQAVGEEVEVQQ